MRNTKVNYDHQSLIMSSEVKNIGKEILYEVPGTCALLFAGAAFYMSEGDPAVR